MIISGARYSGVPQSVNVLSLIYFAKPKSVIFMWPSAATKRFSGFRSRYAIFYLCRYSSASTISVM